MRRTHRVPPRRLRARGGPHARPGFSTGFPRVFRLAPRTTVDPEAFFRGLSATGAAIRSWIDGVRKVLVMLRMRSLAHRRAMDIVISKRFPSPQDCPPDHARA